MVLREAASSLEILFIRRAEDPRDPWSGQIAFPGGRVEPEDPSLEVTAVRETAEEVGLDLAASGECLGPLDELQAMARGRPLSLAIAPYVFRFRGSQVAEPKAEVSSVHWLPLEPLLGPDHQSTMEYVYQGQRLDLPCLRAGELVIWGLTYRMLMELGERLGMTGDWSRGGELGVRR
jgi:8-oxo-dGTP pyrophosphatase MutT (NUDIX family)